MILAVDVGNSTITIGCMDGEKLICKARLATDRHLTSDQYSIELKNVLELYHVRIDTLSGCMFSCVVPPVFNSFRAAIRRVTGKEPLVIGPGVRTGLNIRTDNPAALGSDLIAACVGAVHLYGAPVMVVYMGTATTISVVDEHKNYLGGAIVPGMRLSLDALTQNAAQLPGISLDRPSHVIGRNTVECMRSGTMYGTASMLDGMLDRMEQELGTETRAVATGEAARFVVPLCRHGIVYENDLILLGLAVMYERQAGRQNRT